MKKLFALLLAAVLVFACGAVLFASAEEESENIAPKASYTLHEQYRQGGADVNWAYVETAPISYEDKTGKQLTDGEFGDVNDLHNAWVGLNQNHPDYKGTTNPLHVDFTWEEEQDIGTIRVSVSNLCSSGINAPLAMTAQASEDGEAVIGEYTAELVAGSAATYEIQLNKTTKFVRLNFYPPVTANNAAANNNEPAWLAELADPNAKGSWVFVDEVEIYNGTVSSDSEMESIEIDGVLDDTGWAEDGWIEISEESGLGGIQDTPETKVPFDFDTQLRTDDEWVYVAAIIHLPMENSTGVGSESVRGGTSFRFWVHSSDEYKMYTHFYDVWPDANGNPVTAAKYNTSKTENSGAPIQDSSLVATIKADGDQTIVEMKVKLDEFLEEGATEIHYYVNPVKGFTSGEFVGMVYPEIPLTPGIPSDMPWLNWDVEHQGVLDLEDSKLGEVQGPAAPVTKYPFWVTHFDPEKEGEGTGIIWTATDGAGTYDFHLAFEPVEGKTSVYKLVEKIDGDANSHAINVPEGGFVYSINAGNNWPDLMKDKKGDGASGAWYDDPAHLDMPNFNTDNVKATWNLMNLFEVDGLYTFHDLDIAGKTVPTSTPDMDYWDPEYVCTSTFSVGDNESEDGEPDPDDGYAEAIAAKVGDANDSNLFKTELAAELDDDGNITLTMKISNLKADDKVIGFQIPVYFDAERVDAVLTDIKDEALNCVAEDGMPGSNWENLTAAKVVEKNGESYIYFQCGTAKTDYCDENTELVVTLKFTLKEGFDKAGFWTANATTKCFIDDGLMTTKLGEGSYAIAEEAVEPAPTPTPTPTPSQSDENPGDAGIIVFAILGVLAVIGAAVVIKVRR